MAQYQFSVESIKFYDKGAAGAMGTTNAVTITPIAEGSASMTIPEANTNDIKAEDVAGIVASLPTDQDAIEFNFQSLDFAQFIKCYKCGRYVFRVHTNNEKLL